MNFLCRHKALEMNHQINLPAKIDLAIHFLGLCLQLNKSPETPELCVIDFLIYFQTKKKYDAFVANIAFRHSWKSYVDSIWAILPRLEGQNIFSLWGKSMDLRTEVRGDFNIHGTKYFHSAVFHLKSKKYDVVSLPVPFLGQWNVDRAGYYWKCLLKAFSVITSLVYISWGGRFFWPKKGTGRLTTSSFFDFLMENSTVKIFGSVNIKITPDFCS